jgi:hypothetical protein
VVRMNSFAERFDLRALTAIFFALQQPAFACSG